MSRFDTFEEIGAWQKARKLTNEIYSITATGPFGRDFGLREQVRRACVSIMSNIAEGHERGAGDKEFARFLAMAKGSAGEVRAQLYVALDRGYLDKPTFDKVFALATETSRMISGLITYLRESQKRRTAEP